MMVKKNEKTESDEKKVKSSPIRRMMRLFSRCFLYGTAAVIVLTLGAFIMLQTDPVRSGIKAYLESAVSDASGLQLKVGGISGDLLFSITLEDVTLSQQQNRLLQAGKISATYFAPLLLKNTLFVNEFQIEKGFLKLEKGVDGKWNIPGLRPAGESQKEASTTEFRMAARRVSLTDIDITVVEKTADETKTRRFSDIALIAGFSMTSGEVVHVDLYETRFVLDQPQFELRNLSGEIAYDLTRQRLQFNRIRLRSGESDLSANGFADLNGTVPIVDATAEIKRLSLPEIGCLTSIKAIQRGALTGRVSIEGPLDKLSHRSDIQWERAAIRTEGTITRAAGEGLDLKLNGTIRELNLDMLSSIGLPALTGIVNAKFRINGKHLLNLKPRGTLELEVRDSRFDRYAVDHGNLRLLFDHDALNVAHLDLKTPMGNAIAEGSISGLFDAQKEKTITAHMKLSHLDLTQISQRKDLTGKLNLTLETEAVMPPHTNDFASVLGKMIGKIEASSVLDAELRQGDLDIMWQSGRLDVKRFALDTDAGRIDLTGFAVPQRKTASVKVDMNVPDLKKVGEIAARFDHKLKQPMPLSGNIGVTGRIDGWWDRPSFEGTITAGALRFDQTTVKTLKMTGQWTGSPKSFKSQVKLDLRNALINDIRLSSLTTTASISQDKILINLDATHHEGEKLKLQGQIDPWRDIEKRITIDTLRITAKSSSKTGKFGTHLANQGPIRVSLSPQSVDIRSFKVTSDQAVLSLKGTLNSEKDSTIVLSLSRLNLDRISWLMPKNKRVRGMLSADIKVSGTGKKPNLKAAVQVKNGSGYDVVFTDLAVQLACDRSKLTSAIMLNLQDDQRIELNGKADIQWSLLPLQLNLPGKGLDVFLKAKALDLSKLPIPAIPDLTYNGNLDAALRLSGDAASPALSGDITVKKGSVTYKDQHMPFSRLGVFVDYRKAEAGVKINLERGGRQLLTVNSRSGVHLSLRPFAFKPLDREMEGVLNIRNLNLKELPFLNAAHFDYDGTLDLSATIAGKPASPALTADLSINSGHFEMKNGSHVDVPFSKLAAKLRYQKNRATADITLHRDAVQLMAVNGSSDMSFSLSPFQFKPGTDMEASMISRGLRLAMLPLPKIPGAEIDGMIDVTAQIRGDWKTPQITGALELKDGALTVKRPALSYENLSAAVRLVPGKLIIESVSIAGDKEGSLRCSGDIMLSGFKPDRFNLRLNGEDFSIPFHPAIRARIQPDILLAGNMSAPSLTGTITIPESRLNLDRFVQQGPAEIQVKGRDTDDRGRIQMADTSSRGSALFNPLSADLDVVIPKNAWLKGQGVDAEIGGSINLKKEPQKSFILLGSLRTIRGNYNFQGKQFKFKKGAVSFLGLEDPDPNLDVEAAARIRKVDIIIRIGGTARNLSLSLDSDPPMDQTDIVSYIMFGKPSNSLNDRDSANVEKAALGLTGQMAASELKSILGDNFFLDTITYESGDGNDNKGSVAVGKYVTPDVFVIYRQGLSADQPNELEASYEVNKNISIQSNVGNEKTTGVDVFWEFDF